METRVLYWLVGDLTQKDINEHFVNVVRALTLRDKTIKYFVMNLWPCNVITMGLSVGDAQDGHVDTRLVTY